MEYWAKPEVAGGGSISLIEAVRRALPVHLDAEWRLEYRGTSHHFLRHGKHPWIFEISERKFAGFRPEDAPSPFRIRPPGGPYCPTGTAYEVRLISNSVEQASAVAREVCDRRAGPCDGAASFFRDVAPGNVRWGIIAQVSGLIPRAPADPRRHARPGFDVSGWWTEDSRLWQPFQTLRVIWALRILNEACLRHGPRAISDEWGGGR